MLRSYNTRQDYVDYDCGTCNRTTTATIRNHVRQYPKVLAVAISRGADNGTVIETCVNYPIENFTPYTHSEYQLQDDSGDATYDLVATINYVQNKKGEKGRAKHKKGKNGGGHYTATCKHHNSGVWYDYNDATVTRSRFIKTYRGVFTAKNNFQRSVALLFYIRREPPQENTGIMTGSAVCNDDGSINSGAESRASHVSAVETDDVDNRSQRPNDNVQDDDPHIDRNATTNLGQRIDESYESDYDVSLFNSVRGSDIEVRLYIIGAPIELISTF
jgi:hypothetical protein